MEINYRVKKTITPETGLSCCFRQPKATSHCRLLHGYALGFEIVLGTDKLDSRNWVYDFGGFKPLKAKLQQYFDHTLAIAEGDTEVLRLLQLPAGTPTADFYNLQVFKDGVGCERFAQFVYELATTVLPSPTENRVFVLEVTCFEHGANSATYCPHVPKLIGEK